MKILIIRFSSIGDIVLTSPVIRCLKIQTGAEIHYLTKKIFEKILISNPYVDKVFSIQKDVNEVLSELKLMNYDYIIDLHKNLRSWHVKKALSAKSYSFNKLNIEKWLMVNLKINYLPNKHIVDRNLETVAYLGVENDSQGLDYFIPNEDVINIEKLNEIYGSRISPFNYVAFVIGAAHATKRLPIEKIIAICNGLKMPVVLLGGKEDFENGEIISTHSKHYVLNLCSKLNLNQSASIVQQAKLVITHDTGLMHIAAAFNKKIISVWGNTIPEFGMYPYSPLAEKGCIDKHYIMEVEGLSCRPCSKIGYAKCPKGHFKCMQMIDTEGVIMLANS